MVAPIEVVTYGLLFSMKCGGRMVMSTASNEGSANCAAGILQQNSS
jgi:hypothetical protein